MPARNSFSRASEKFAENIFFGPLPRDNPHPLVFTIRKFACIDLLFAIPVAPRHAGYVTDRPGNKPVMEDLGSRNDNTRASRNMTAPTYAAVFRCFLSGFNLIYRGKCIFLLR